MTLPIQEDATGEALDSAHKEYEAFLEKGFGFNTGKVSDLVRQLSLAGIAIVWLYHGDGQAKPYIPHALIAPTALFIVAVTCDLLQYVVGAWENTRALIQVDREGVKAVYAREIAASKRTSRLDKIRVLGLLHHLTISGVLFAAKTGALMVAFGFLIQFLVEYGHFI